MGEAWIIDAVRTPRGRGKKDVGALVYTHPQELMATTLCALAARNGIDPHDVNDVVVGCVSQAGDQGACSHPLIGVLSGDEGGIIECNTEKEYPMPHYDLGLLVTLDMTLILMGVLAAMIGVWVIVRHLTRLAEIKALLGGQ